MVEAAPLNRSTAGMRALATTCRNTTATSRFSFYAFAVWPDSFLCRCSRLRLTLRHTWASFFLSELFWSLTELLVRHYKLDGKIEGRVSQVMRNIDMSTILFFLGILMAVAALSRAGILGELAAWLNDTFHDVYIINGIIGVLSSIVDNVPSWQPAWRCILWQTMQ